jgi:putative molybdopterin biosynthesis protein
MERKRNVYLSLEPLDRARQRFVGHFALDRMLGAETIAAADAVGRTLSEPVFARISAPSYHGAEMDGVAVRAEDTFGAREGAPLELRVPDQAVPVNTGDVLPEGKNAVIMIEQVRQLEEGLLSVEAAAYPWQHVRRVGEDIVATEMLFTRHHVVTPVCLGALLLGGVLHVAVKSRPRVLVIPTGAEIVEPSEQALTDLRPGQIIDANSTMLSALVASAGGVATRRARLPDDPEALAEALRAATRGDFDLVLVIGGSSAGAGDFTRAAIADAGEVLVHGVTMMPGKPTVLGAVGGRPVVGIPGYPVSAIMAFEQLVRPALAAMLCRPVEPPRTAEVELSRKVASKLGLEEFLRVRLGRVGDTLVATPLARGAGSVSSITQADAIVRIPPNVEGLSPRQPVQAELLRPLASIEETLVAVGSHDNALDHLADLLRQRNAGVRLCSSHVGSLGGLLAVGRGVCHLAGSHLLDPSDGSYNVSYLRKHLAGVPVKLVHLAMRQQGLIVAPGNPRGLRSIEDLGRRDVRFVNRQAGSGTRVLLDYHLERLSIAPRSIRGYETEEFTHMAVAVAVLSGSADAALGILAAARALGLDFVPLVEEQYDLVIPERFFATRGIQELLATLRSTELRERVRALGGYRLDRTGEVLIG